MPPPPSDHPCRKYLQHFQAVFIAGRWPVGIYPRALRYILTFIVPIAFAVTVPAEGLIGRLTPNAITTALSVATGLFLISRLIWRTGIKQYSGASA